MNWFEKKREFKKTKLQMLADAKFTEFSTVFYKFHDLQIFCFLSIFLYTGQSFSDGYLGSYEF